MTTIYDRSIIIIIIDIFLLGFFICSKSRKSIHHITITVPADEAQHYFFKRFQGEKRIIFQCWKEI